MAEGKDKGQRRVYVLPSELVERIEAYREEMGLASEVEAARRLLDGALKSRDNWKSITDRFLARLDETKVLADIAKDVLVGHPLVVGVQFEAKAIKFGLNTGESVEITDSGIVIARDESGSTMKHRKSEGFSREMDDEIPF